MAKSLISVFSNPNARAGEAGSTMTGAGHDSGATSGATLSNTAPRSVMILGKTLRFKGELAADEDLLLLGQVHGSITHTGSLTVGFGGVVRGDVRARIITIKGMVEGDLEASDAIIVSPSGNVTGDLIAPSVSIVEGATFNGAVRMPRVAADAAAKGDTSSRTTSSGVLNDTAVDRMLSSP